MDQKILNLCISMEFIFDLVWLSQTSSEKRRNYSLKFYPVPFKVPFPQRFLELSERGKRRQFQVWTHRPVCWASFCGCAELEERDPGATEAISHSCISFSLYILDIIILLDVKNFPSQMGCGGVWWGVLGCAGVCLESQLPKSDTIESLWI